MDVQGNQAHIVSRKPARRAKGKVLRIRNRKGGSRYVRSTGESCILTPQWYKMVCDWAGEECQPELNPLPKFQGDHASEPHPSSTSSKRQQKKRMRMLTSDENGCPIGYFVPWSDHTLFLHPKESKIAGIVKKCRWDGARGVIIVPVRIKETWFWSLGEVTVNWWYLARDEPIFQDVHGGQHMQEPDTQYRAIAFDCMGDQQEGVNRTELKRRAKYNLDSEGGFNGVIVTLTSHKGQNNHFPRQRTNLFGKRPKGTDRKRWRLKCHKLALLEQGPVDTPDPELLEDSRRLTPEPLVQLQVEEMNARYKGSELQLAETKALDQFQEASAKLTQICSTDAQGVVPDKGTPTGPDLKAKTDPPAWMVRSFAEVTKHGPSLDKHDRSCEKVSHLRTKVDPILREPIPLMGSDLAPLTALFQDREHPVRSVIEADGEILGELATELRNCINEDFADSVFDPTGNEYGKIDVNALKRGPKDVSFCKLELKPASQPRACNPIRAVGI